MAKGHVLSLYLLDDFQIRKIPTDCSLVWQRLTLWCSCDAWCLHWLGLNANGFIFHDSPNSIVLNRNVDRNVHTQREREREPPEASEAAITILWNKYMGVVHSCEHDLYLSAFGEMHPITSNRELFVCTQSACISLALSARAVLVNKIQRQSNSMRFNLRFSSLTYTLVLQSWLIQLDFLCSFTIESQ